MDEKNNQAEEQPVPAADPTQREETSPAPTVDTDQGVSTTVENTSNQVPSSEGTEAQTGQDENSAAAASEAPAAAVTEESAPEAPAVAAESTPAASDEMTMEDVLAASDEQLARKPVHRGMITTGEVIMLTQDGVVVDVGAKIEGILPYNQLFEQETTAEEAAQSIKPGDELQVYVIRADIPNNTIVLSKKRADQERAWNLLQEIFEKEKPVEVEIVEKVRGGLVANLGIRAFLPASQVDVRRVNDLAPFVGQRLKVRIIELNRKRNRVIISRRAILEEEMKEQKGETLQQLEPGARLEGEVVEVTDFGAFVNLGGIDGLVHRSELTHGRFNHPRDVVSVGDKVRVEVLDMDLERERINLSMKKLIANPWDEVLVNYHIGQKIAGKVTNLTPFGAFVEIEPGLEGLIHVSEMSWTKRVRHPKEIVTEGEEVEAMILKIDTQQERISLGLRQTQPDPWSSLPDRFPPGTEVTGPITGITEFGVFMEIEEGIEGLVHISELSHDHIENIGDSFSRGDEITAVIINIDPVEQRASLSRRRLLPYTASEFDGAAAGQARGGAGGGRRSGRRGGRRSAGIDYDYSYAAADTGAKATTKLGDVYADLFAQFGLSDSKSDDAEADTTADSAAPAGETVAASQDEAEVTAEAEAAPAEAPATEDETAVQAEAEAPAAEESAAAAAAPAADSSTESAAVADAEPTENAIDAAEAAAMLTAAFREGKRPTREAETKEAEAAADADVTAEEAGDADSSETADASQEDDSEQA